MKLLENKYALVTGGGRGIGRSVALEFAKNGANVAVAARTKSELDRTVEDIRKFGVNGLAIPADLSTLDGVSNCATSYFEKYERCDILVNNAGMTQFATVVEYPIEKVQQLFNLNIMGTYAMTKEILPKMIEQGGGRIIMTSSVQGNTFFSSKKVAYSTSKGAITVMAKTLQAEVRPQKIYVSVVMPGGVQTKFVEDLTRWGQQMPEGIPPEAISPIYLFLASDMAKRRYMGKIINQHTLYELLPEVEKKIGGSDYNIDNVFKSMKENLSKAKYEQFRENKELIDFLLKYEEIKITDHIGSLT